MKVFLDKEEILEIKDSDIKLLANDLLNPIEEIKRRLKYIIEHKLDQCFKRMKDEWIPKLEKENLNSIPLKRKDFTDLITKRSDYKNRKERENK